MSGEDKVKFAIEQWGGAQAEQLERLAMAQAHIICEIGVSSENGETTSWGYCRCNERPGSCRCWSCVVLFSKELWSLKELGHVGLMQRTWGETGLLGGPQEQESMKVGEVSGGRGEAV